MYARRIRDSAQRPKRPQGQVRQSQVITTFGPGSMFDLPNHAVLVGGLDHWLTRGDEIHEPRLVAKLVPLIGAPNLTLHAPPPDTNDPTASQKTGITVWQFPEWFITQDVLRSEGGRSVRWRRLVHRVALTRGKFVDEDRKAQPVVPVRFVRACPRGHIGDINWYTFTHHGDTACRRPLWMIERGTSGDLSEVSVRCECGLERDIVEAAGSRAGALGKCDGAQPWLGPRVRDECHEMSRMLVRTASNAYFPQTMRAISLPERDEAIVKAVDQVWEHYLKDVETSEDLAYERRKRERVKNALEGFTDEEIIGEIRSRRGGTAAAEDKSVKQAELESLVASDEEIGSDKPDGDFYARTLPRAHWEQTGADAIERVVLVHRLREVTAQVGFTRFEPSAPDIDGELEMGVERAPFAREVSWLPAVENRGEGVFLQFQTASIDEWRERPAVRRRGEHLRAGYDCWLADHKESRRKFPELLPYLMLHSLSHLLITAVSLECGYPASSIRERVYASPSGYGILLYTGTPDAEGTLGGLVEAGRQIGRHLRAALDLGGLCSNDPVCAQHAAEDPHECRFLHGAACHGCLLIAETSCEQFNAFLDRALVVPTVDHRRAEFFRIGH